MSTVDIIIPIYNSYEYTKECIDSVYKNTDLPYHLYLINDGSTDTNVLELLKDLQAAVKPNNLQLLEVIHQKQQEGFVRSVNRGLKRSKNHAVLLNSDTVVPKKWLSRIVFPILSNNTIASVTPFSNNADLCSFPSIQQKNSIMESIHVDIVDEVFLKYGTSQFIEIPTGVGFCMALNRHVIEEIGMFDEGFGLGYGEENDWCMRARKAGYKNVLIPNLYVFHHGGTTFNSYLGKQKKHHQLKNLKRLRQRHPDFVRVHTRFRSEDPMKQIRDHLFQMLKITVFNKED